MSRRAKSSKATRPAAAGERRGGVRAVAALLPRVAGRALGRRGFAEAGLITDWPEIVGADVARWLMPERLSFARGARAAGTLHLRVAGAVALEVQHAAPAIIERINGYLGYPAVARLALRQGPLPARPRAVRRPPPEARLPQAQEATLAARLEPLPDGPLKEALAGLGRAIAQRECRTKAPLAGAEATESDVSGGPGRRT